MTKRHYLIGRGRTPAPIVETKGPNEVNRAQSLTQTELAAYVAAHTVEELKAEVKRLMSKANETGAVFALSTAGQYQNDANSLMVAMMDAGKF